VKILWVKAGGLVPLDSGGKIRSYNILRELARNHAVTFFSFYAAHTNDQHPALKNVFEQVVCTPLSLPAPKSFSEMLGYSRNVFSLKPYNLMKYCRTEARFALDSLLRHSNFDVIVCDFLTPAPIVPWRLSIPKVIFTHNVEAVIWKRHYDVAKNPLWKALSWREWKTMERAERTYLQKAEHVLTVSEGDRNSFLTFLDASKLSVIPTGVDVEYFCPRPGEEIRDSLVFTGSMDWLPNEDGIFHFVEQALPHIREKTPGVSVAVVGRNPSPRLRDLASRVANITLTGWVDDVRPHLARGSVCIVPLRIGGGTRLKIFEAMAMGKAIVSTTIGAEGLPVRDGENIVLGDGPQIFASRTIELLQDSVRRNSIGAAAHKLVSENYSWERIASRFSDILDRVAGVSQSPREIGTNVK